MTAYHRAKGSSFERTIADGFKANGYPFADRRVKNGAKDRGDIGGIHAHNQPVVIECKNTTRTSLATWIKEAETERLNDGALAGIVVHKRVGKAQALDQYVTLTMRDLIALLTGKRL